MSDIEKLKSEAFELSDKNDDINYDQNKEIFEKSLFDEILEIEDINPEMDLWHLARKTRYLSSQDQVQLAKEYNALENPTYMQTKIMASLDVDYGYTPVFFEDEAEEVVKAFVKCAEQIAKDREFNDDDKYQFGRYIKYLVCRQPEVAAQAFAALENLTDVNVIEAIRSCMSRDHSLIDKGFAAIHKSADSICAKEAARDVSNENPKRISWQHKHPKQAAAQDLNLAFADLYNFHGFLNNVELIDKITGYFIEFEKQMSPEWCNLDRICRGAAHHSEDKGNSDIGKKMYLLSECFEEWKKGKQDFKSIMEEKIEHKAFIKKVQEKIKERAGTVGLIGISENDHKFLWRVEGNEPDYLKLKKEGKSGDADIIADNKLLMKARKELRDQQK